MRMFAAIALFCSSLVLGGCAQVWRGFSAGGDVLPAPRESSSPIKHVVILIQENRSFDNLFATFPGADGATQGNMGGTIVPLVKGDLITYDVAHGHSTFVTEYDHGKMDGFAVANASIHHVLQKVGQYNYRYVDPRQIRPYWNMAKQYVLADHLFQTQSSGSFTAHQDLIAGGTALDRWESVIDDPSDSGGHQAAWGCDAPAGTWTSVINSKREYLRAAGPFPC